MTGMFIDAQSFNQKLCGAAWVHSNAKKRFMFVASKGSITSTVCTSASTSATKQVTIQHITRRPLPDRELVVRTPITTPVAVTSTILSKMTCPKCGTFEKSGQASCCAPGGTWYKNCGGDNHKNMNHKWFEGTEACKRKSILGLWHVVIYNDSVICCSVFLLSFFKHCPHENIRTTDCMS